MQTLLSPSFSLPSLAAVLMLQVVREQRLLQDSIACFAPGLDVHPGLCVQLANVLADLKVRVGEYD